MITLENVSKSYKNLKLFENLNVTFAENKKIMIVGVNGSGKSVLMKMIVGYALPDNGTITVDGKKIGKDADFIENVGTFINAPEFISYLSGYENLKRLKDIRKVISDKELMEWVKLFGLQDDIKKKYKTYSLGMKQKMRLIQAFMDKPKYLIIDEPFDALDQKSKDLLVSLLNEFIKVPGHTLIYTSHIDEVKDFADEIYKVEAYGLQKIK